MKLYKGSILFLTMIFILTACGNEPLSKLEYADFKESIAQKDFTGFAYILSDYKAEDGNYISVIGDVFDAEGENLIYFNDQAAPDQVHEAFNEDSKRKDLYLPIDKIAYIEGGKPIKEIEITEELITEGDHENLKQFIQDQK